MPKARKQIVHTITPVSGISYNPDEDARQQLIEKHIDDIWKQENPVYGTSKKAEKNSKRYYEAKKREKRRRQPISRRDAVIEKKQTHDLAYSKRIVKEVSLQNTAKSKKSNEETLPQFLGSEQTKSKYKWSGYPFQAKNQIAEKLGAVVAEDWDIRDQFESCYRKGLIDSVDHKKNVNIRPKRRLKHLQRQAKYIDEID